jgi:hypothetical protein
MPMPGKRCSATLSSDAHDPDLTFLERWEGSHPNSATKEGSQWLMSMVSSVAGLNVPGGSRCSATSWFRR